jgi:hypothetical protein
VEWIHTQERDGEVIYHMEGVMPDPPVVMDALSRMSHAAAGTTGNNAPTARVSTTVQHSLPYGEVKVSFTVTVTVPQEKQWMDYAAEHILAQAVNYVNAGMASVVPGAPLLPQPIPRTP